MTEWEISRQYRSVTGRIGAALLIFLGLSEVFGTISLLLTEVWNYFLIEVAAEIVTSLTSGVTYVLSFMLPICFYRLMSRGKSYEPMKLMPRLPRETFVYIMAGLAVTLAAAYLNYYMISFTDYAEFAEEMLWLDTYNSPHAIVMAFATTAIIPAFVEEFLFRGLIQTNLRPYGRGVAIVGSAVLFGMMHRNIQQIFYTTVAGLVLGYLYEITDSLWCSILMHFLNNANSVISGAISALYPTAMAERILVLIEGAIFGIGAICLIYLICRKQKIVDFSQGVFETSLPGTSPEYAEYTLDSRSKIKLFFAPTMIVFFAMSIATTLLLFLLSFVPVVG